MKTNEEREVEVVLRSAKHERPLWRAVGLPDSTAVRERGAAGILLCHFCFFQGHIGLKAGDYCGDYLLKSDPCPRCGGVQMFCVSSWLYIIGPQTWAYLARGFDTLPGIVWFD